MCHVLWRQEKSLWDCESWKWANVATAPHAAATLAAMLVQTMLSTAARRRQPSAVLFPACLCHKIVGNHKLVLRVRAAGGADLEKRQGAAGSDGSSGGRASTHGCGNAALLSSFPAPALRLVLATVQQRTPAANAPWCMCPAQ